MNLNKPSTELTAVCKECNLFYLEPNPSQSGLKIKDSSTTYLHNKQYCRLCVRMLYKVHIKEKGVWNKLLRIFICIILEIYSFSSI